MVAIFSSENWFIYEDLRDAPNNQLAGFWLSSDGWPIILEEPVNNQNFSMVFLETNISLGQMKPRLQDWPITCTDRKTKIDVINVLK